MWTNQVMRIKNNMYYNTDLECWVNLGDYTPISEFLNEIPLKTLAIIDKCYRIIHNIVPEEKDLIDAIKKSEIMYNDDYVWVVDRNRRTNKSICCRIDDCILVGLHETLQGFHLHGDYDLWKDVEIITEIEIADIAYINDLLN